MVFLIVINFFIVGATSELYFSKSGLIVSETCAAVSPANVNKLVCLNNWLGL